MTPADAAAHVIVGNLSDDAPVPTLAANDERHLTRVLRLVPGSDVTVGDGRGRWRHCRLMTGGALEPAGEIVAEPPPKPELTIAFALIKGDRPELVIRKLTEIGVDRIVPFIAERSVVRWASSKVNAKIARLTEIARSAAMQSRRSFVPVIGVQDVSDGPSAGLPDFATAATLEAAALADTHGAPPSLTWPAVLVGPEGGWSPSERRVGLPRVQLANHVLRTETAATTAGALLVALRSGLVAAAEPFE